MTFWWLIIWFLKSGPELHMWNAWAVGLIVCAVLDFVCLGCCDCE